MKVKLKFFFPLLIKIKSFREASSHIFSPYLKRKNFGGKQNFPPKSCFPNLETKSANSIASVEKACLNSVTKKNPTATIIISTSHSLQTSPVHILVPKKLSLNKHILYLRWKLVQLQHYHHRSFGIVFTTLKVFQRITFDTELKLKTVHQAVSKNLLKVYRICCLLVKMRTVP